MKFFLKQTMIAIAFTLVSASSFAQHWNSSLDGGRGGFLVGYGFTGGGDRLNAHITAGRGTALVIGAEYRFNKQLSLQLNGSLHSSDIIILDSLMRSDHTGTSPNNVDRNGRPLYCDNGTCQEQFGTSVRDYSGISFNRTPVELLVHAFLSEQIRIGGGIRTIRYASLTGSNVVSDERLGNSNGGVLELEVFEEQRTGSIKLRVAKDRFQTPQRGAVDAAHVGVYFSAYFF